MEQVLFSEIIKENHLAGSRLIQIKKKKIIFDYSSFNLSNAIMFSECVFEGLDSATGMVRISTTESFRAEWCDLCISICILGEARKSSKLEYLEKNGPNIFFDDVIGKEYESSTVSGPSHKLLPKIQISGVVNHSRVRPSEKGSICDFTISQCHFSKLEIQNEFGKIQAVDYKGGEMYFKDFDTYHIWFRENLKSKVGYVEFDMQSIRNIEKRVLSQKDYNNMFTNSIKMIMEILRNRKEGRKFNKVNNALCHLLSHSGNDGNGNSSIGSKLLYGWFKNFYSIGRMVLTSLLVIIAFSFIYWLFSSETGCFGYVSYTTNTCLRDIVGFWDSFYFSAITFTTVGYGDIQPSGFLRLVSAFEGYLGVSLVLVSSFVFGRQFSDY